MAGETPQQDQLAYATPVHTGGVNVLRRPGHFHVDLGPMPAALFVAELIPHLVLPALVLAGLVALSLGATNFRPKPILAVVVLGALLPPVRPVVRLSRHRHVPRSVGGTAECVYYSNAATRGRPDSVLRQDLSSVGVRRLWLQPWVFELVAVLKYKFLTLTARETEPVVLLSALDRAALEDLAVGLRDVGETSVPAASPPQSGYTSTKRDRRLRATAPPS